MLIRNGWLEINFLVLIVRHFYPASRLRRVKSKPERWLDWVEYRLFFWEYMLKWV